MSRQEVTIALVCLVSVGIYTAYAIWAFTALPGLETSLADQLITAARALLIMIGAQIVAAILVHIFASIGYGIATRECQSTMEDERDRLLETQSNAIAAQFAGFGTLGSIVLLALGWHVVLVINLIIFMLFIGNVIGELVKLYHYRQAA